MASEPDGEPEPKAASCRIRRQSEDIRAALPADVRDTVKTQEWATFITEASRAVELYLARPSAPRRRRQHRRTAEQQHPGEPHRPPGTYRQGLIADLFDSYMTLRQDNLEARGFKGVADAVCEAAGISVRVTNRDCATLRTTLMEQIAAFNRLVGDSESK